MLSELSWAAAARMHRVRCRRRHVDARGRDASPLGEVLDGADSGARDERWSRARRRPGHSSWCIPATARSRVSMVAPGTSKRDIVCRVAAKRSAFRLGRRHPECRRHVVRNDRQDGKGGRARVAPSFQRWHALELAPVAGPEGTRHGTALSGSTKVPQTLAGHRGRRGASELWLLSAGKAEPGAKNTR
jgi:hypothetical protein